MVEHTENHADGPTRGWTLASYLKTHHSAGRLQFVIANSDHRDHPALARAIRNYVRWRNAHTRDPDVLAAQRRHAARLRSEKQRRWGHPRTTVA